MIIFKTVTLKNFLSFGDNPTTVRLDVPGTTLITGKNGSGKSTVITESVIFALFGKSFRGIIKGALANTTNKKDCLVILTFAIGDDNYVLSRGISPNILSLEKNGNELQMGGSAKEFQQKLESLIGFQYDTAIRTLVIGFADYKPFMRMSLQERRAFSDAGLGVGILTEVAASVRAERTTIANLLSNVQTKFDSLKMQYQSKMSTIDKLESAANEEVQIDVVRIDSINDKIAINALAMLVHEAVVNSKGDVSAKVEELTTGLTKASGMAETCKIKIKDAKEKLKFFETTDVCPTCLTPIADGHLELRGLMGELETEIEKQTKQLNSINEMISKVRANLEVTRNVQREVQSAKESIRELKYTNQMLTEQVNDLKNVKKPTLNLDLINSLKSDADALVVKIRGAHADIDLVKDKLDVVTSAVAMLKDDGIRASIIREYVPVINQIVNDYLDALGFGIRIELDENFNDKLKGRFVDEFTYNSLSQGERQRIDLAMMFAWRKVAAICSGVDTNLLILDEVADAAMDSSGVDSLMELLLVACPNTSVMIVSHRSEMSSWCDNVITVEKKDGFSKMC